MNDTTYNYGPYRYEKNAPINIQGEEYTLIEYLKILREENNITKTQISRVVKNNDYWYSQLEMKNDNNRRKFIKHIELVNIISVIKFKAASKTDLKNFFRRSEDYVIYNLALEPMDYVTDEMFHRRYVRSSETQENMIEDTLQSITKQLETFYKHLLNNNASGDLSRFLDVLRNLKSSLTTDIWFTLEYIGVPLQDFLLSSSRSEKEQLIDEISNCINDYANSDSTISKEELGKMISEILHKYKYPYL